jgi:hypothetical protein
MLCIELTRNGKRLATAGLPGNGVVSLIFDRVLSEHRGPKEHRHFSLGGLDTTTDPQTSVHWTGGDVQVGDSFIVRFIDLDAADKPTHSEPSKSPTTAELRRYRKRQLRHLEAEIKRAREWLATNMPNAAMGKSAGPSAARKSRRSGRPRKAMR